MIPSGTTSLLSRGPIVGMLGLSVCAAKTKTVSKRIDADVESCGDFEMVRKLKKNERQ
jgi:hypothetical protein